MDKLIDISRCSQQTICLALAAVIVAVTLSLGAHALTGSDHGYSVTITQLS